MTRQKAINAFLLVSLAGMGSIPGVPDFCCGRQDCKPASVQILSKDSIFSVVRIEGKTLHLPAGRVFRSRFSSYYCFNKNKEKCKGGVVSKECALCAIEGGGLVNTINTTPLADNRWLLTPVGQDCQSCHAGKGKG